MKKSFGKYLIELIDMIFPDAADVDGKRLIVKIDSGPDCTNPYLLAKLRLRGVVLYPGCPNNTSVSQETDMNHGSFQKRGTEQTRRNLPLTASIGFS